MALGTRRKTTKKCPPQSGCDFELNTRTRAPAIGDVCCRFTRELWPVGVSNVEAGGPEFRRDTIPSCCIATTDMNHSCLAVLSMNGENCVETLQGVQAFRFVKTRACNVQVAVLGSLKTFEEVKRVVTCGYRLGEFGRARLNAAA